MPGALELCALLDSRRVPRALLTRNVNSSVEFFQRMHFHTLPPFVPALTREFHFYKPVRPRQKGAAGQPGGYCVLCRDGALPHALRRCAAPRRIPRACGTSPASGKYRPRS